MKKEEQIDASVHMLLAGKIDRLAERVAELERHVPQRIDAHESELTALRLALHNIDVRTTQMQSMIIEDHSRLERIHRNSNRTVELLELTHGKTVVVEP